MTRVFECADNAVNRAHKLMKQLDERLHLGNLRLVDRYLRGELNLVVHLLIGEVGKEFVALLQRYEGLPGVKEDVELGNLLTGEGFRHISSHDGAEVDTVQPRCNGEYETVLVDIVKAVEFPKQVIPTLVRFGCVDCVYRTLPRSLYLSKLFGFVERGGVLDGDIAGDQRNYLGNCGNGINVVRWPSCLRIALGSDFVGAGTVPCGDSLLEVCDVLFGPFDFRFKRLARRPRR